MWLTAGCDGEIDNIPTTPDPVIVTDTFTGRLTVNGAQTHNVFTGATGVVTATITSLGETRPKRSGSAWARCLGRHLHRRRAQRQRRGPRPR